MNLAALWKLPVVFVVEENQYGEMTRQCDHQTVVNIADRAVAYNMPAATVDGNDVLAVHEAAAEAIKRARAGKGPSMVECKTFRIKGHYIGDPEGYRDKEEVKEWQADDKDPIPRFVKVLVDKGVATEAEIEAIKQEVQGEIDKAVKFAEAGPTPEPADLLENVYA
jgi:pyruvate dehydrogenase E1 component alpha subunit